MEPEKQETFTIDFVMNDKDASVQVVGTYSNVKMIYELITGNKSLWLENENGTHPIDIVSVE